MGAGNCRARADCDLGAFPGHGADRRGVDGARPFRQVTGAPVRRDPWHRAARGSRRAGARRGPGGATGRPCGQPRALPDLRCGQLHSARDPGPGPHPARVDGGAVRHRRRRRDPRCLAERAGRPRRGRLRQAGDDFDARLLQPRRDPRLAGRRRPRLGWCRAAPLAGRRRRGRRAHRRHRRTLAPPGEASPRDPQGQPGRVIPCTFGNCRYRKTRRTRGGGCGASSWRLPCSACAAWWGRARRATGRPSTSRTTWAPARVSPLSASPRSRSR